MKEFATSFRGRLTLLTLATLAVSITLYSFLLGWINLTRLSEQIDQDLMNRARMVANRPPPPPQNPDGPDAMNPPPGEDLRSQRPPPEMPRGPGAREIRMIDESGRVVGGQPEDTPFDAKLADQAKNGTESYATVSINGNPARVFATPWMRPDGQRGAVEVMHDLRDFNGMKSTMVWTWIALTPLALALSALAAFAMTGRALGPLKVMQQAASRIGEGNLNQRLRVTGNDELAQLATAFNDMAEKLHKSFADQAAAYESLKEAYESQRRFTADASHELRTPLARLQLATSSALRGPEDGYKPALETADNAAKTMAKLTRELLTLARADAGQLGLRHEVFDLRLAVSNALNETGREVIADFPSGPLLVNGDEDHLTRVFANLIENATRHTPADKPIRVSLTQADGKAVVQVADEGEGIAEDHLPHLFERFYRVDPARARQDGGVGLGLAICKSIVEAHEGSIHVESRLGHGTLFTIILPAA